VSPATNSVPTTVDEITPVVAFDNAPPRNAVTTLAEQAGLKAVFEPALLNQKVPEVTVRWTKVTARQALAGLLDNYGWQMTQSPDSTVRISIKYPKAIGPRGIVVNWLEKSPTNGAADDEVIATMSLKGVPVPDAIRALALQAGLNIQFDPALLSQKAADGTLIWCSKVTEKWEKLTARQILQTLLNKLGWQVTQLPGNIFLIGPMNP
jgi:hypothetical protein